MKAFKITKNVYWVGAIDRGIKDFHGYLTKKGTTYNAYLVMADKPVLIDTVKRPFMDEMLARIASVIEPSKIKYIVSNHSEMDHSGSLPEVIGLIKPEKVLASAMGVKALEDHFHSGHMVEAVANASTLDLGNMELKFFETRMLHWPDSMFTYLAADNILFSQDAFGMHLASDERFADEVDEDVWRYEAKKYYANILLPYSSFVLKLIEQWPSLKLDVKFVAPDHGPIWRDGGAKIIGLYKEWAEQRPSKKAVIIYDTMWGSTAAMAAVVKEGLVAGGAEVKLMPLSSSHRSDVATEVLDASALIAGSPTLNNGIFPTLADVLTYLKGLRKKGLVGAAFGSFGWGGEAVPQLNELLKAMNVQLVGDGVKVKYVPTTADLQRCKDLGTEVAKCLRK